MVFNKISKAQIKHIRSLQLKKYRQKYNQFIVEGVKSVDEFLGSSLKCVGFYGNQDFLIERLTKVSADVCSETTSKQLEQISNLKSSQDVLAIFEPANLGEVDTSVDLILALDDIRDPGNLGTIIRTAEWFGLNEIVCSLSSADCYNSKVIQATMGSLSRVKVHYVDLESFIAKQNEFQLVLADMAGENYKKYNWQKNILIIGNEGQGVSDYIRSMQADKVTIPRKGNAESLNAAISTAILLSEIC